MGTHGTNNGASKTPVYDERGVLIAYVTGDAESFRVVDTREPAPTEQDLMVQRLNQKLREGRKSDRG